MMSSPKTGICRRRNDELELIVLYKARPLTMSDLCTVLKRGLRDRGCRSQVAGFKPNRQFMTFRAAGCRSSEARRWLRCIRR
jgi:hypothetical protein